MPGTILRRLKPVIPWWVPGFALLILLAECTLFNVGYWSSRGASEDSPTQSITTGAGLERADNGMYLVSDPTTAYFDLNTDGSSRYLRIDVLDATDFPYPGSTPKLTTLEQVVVRVDTDGVAGRSRAVYVDSPSSLFLTTQTSHQSEGATGAAIRVWVQEPAYSLIPISTIQTNVKVPFGFNWTRVALMAILLALVTAWRPRSPLWSRRLSCASVRQRCALAVALAPWAISCIVMLVQQTRYFTPLIFENPGNYVYDYEQYGILADSLIHGHLWLDLPVPEALKEVLDPYNTAQRERLMAEGVSPIYWDHAYYQGHWYSYFGVLPAVLLFIPYRLITSLWVDGGVMMTAQMAVNLFMFGFLVFGSLLVVRVLVGISRRTSLASTSIALVTFIIGSNSRYLWFRTNFYSVPIAASLMFSCMGLWFWLGARRHASGGGRLPLRHVVAGSLCIAANFGCRPNFVLVSLLAIPIFWDQIVGWLRLWWAQRHAEPAEHGSGTAHDLVAGSHARDSLDARDDVAENATNGVQDSLDAGAVTDDGVGAGAGTGIGIGVDAGVLSGRWSEALRFLVALAVPAVLVVAPLTWYNAARFGSPLSFGNRYQFTVTDMTNYTQPVENILPILGYYLFLPLRFVDTFPFIAINPTPLPQWGFTEPMVAGLFVFCPLALLAFAVPWMRRRIESRPYWGFLNSCLALGLSLLVIDVVIAGLGWRYIADFGWLITLAAMPGLLTVVGETKARSGLYPAERPTRAVMAGRTALVIIMLAMLLIAAATAFVPGRDDEMVRNYPAMFYEVRSWFDFF